MIANQWDGMFSQNCKVSGWNLTDVLGLVLRVNLRWTLRENFIFTELTDQKIWHFFITSHYNSTIHSASCHQSVSPKLSLPGTNPTRQNLQNLQNLPGTSPSLQIGIHIVLQACRVTLSQSVNINNTDQVIKFVETWKSCCFHYTSFSSFAISHQCEHTVTI